MAGSFMVFRLPSVSVSSGLLWHVLSSSLSSGDSVNLEESKRGSEDGL